MLRIKVTPDDGEEYVVEVLARDILVWERTGRGRAFGNFASGGMKMEDVYALAHIAATRTKRTALALPAFEETADVEPLADEEEADPTLAAP